MTGSDCLVSRLCDVRKLRRAMAFDQVLVFVMSRSIKSLIC